MARPQGDGAARPGTVRCRRRAGHAEHRSSDRHAGRGERPHVPVHAQISGPLRNGRGVRRHRAQGFAHGRGAATRGRGPHRVGGADLCHRRAYRRACRLGSHDHAGGGFERQRDHRADRPPRGGALRTTARRAGAGGRIECQGVPRRLGPRGRQDARAGRHPRRAGRLSFLAERPRHADTRRRHRRVAGGHVRVSLHCRIQSQSADTFRTGAGHRHGRGRCHRGSRGSAGEVRRRMPLLLRGDRFGDGRDNFGGHHHHDRLYGRVHPHVVSGRYERHVLHAVRADDGRGGGHLHHQCPDALSGALRPADEAGDRAARVSGRASTLPSTLPSPV